MIGISFFELIVTIVLSLIAAKLAWNTSEGDLLEYCFWSLLFSLLISFVVVAISHLVAGIILI